MIYYPSILRPVGNTPKGSRQFFFPNADASFNWEKGIQFLDKEMDQVILCEDIKAPKYVDKLIKVNTHRGDEEFILLHVEIQGYKDNDFQKRMFTYFYRIWDKHRKPVTAIAVLTDGNKNFRPASYRYSCMGTHLTYQFNMYKVIDQDEETLSKNENPFAIIVLTVLLAIKQERLTIEDTYKLKLDLARNLLSRSLPVPKTRAIMNFLKFYVHFGDQRINDNFEKEISTIINKTETMGIEELILDCAKKEGLEKGLKQGVKKGIKEAKTLFVKNLLLNTEFNFTTIASLADVPEEFVREVKKRA